MLHFIAAVAALTAGAGERPWVDPEPGIKVGAPITLAPSGRGPSAVAIGNGFVAAWLEPDPDFAGDQRHACVVVSLLGAEGRPSTPAHRLSCAQDLGPPQLAAGGGRVAVAWGKVNGIEVRVLSPDLERRAELHLPLPRIPERVSVSHDGSSFALAWSTYDETAALSFTADGARPHDQPVVVDRRTSATDTEGADVACVSSGTCAVLFRHFYGNSRTATGSARLEGGALEGSFGGRPGPFELKALAGDGQLVIFYSTYDRIWGESVFAGNVRVFDYQSPEHRIRDMSGAIGPQGTLIAWNMEPREGAKRGTAITYIHRDPNARRPRPLVIPDAIAPAVATLDGRRFVVLTGSYGMGPVHARFVEVDPARFGAPPAPRSPALEGAVQGPNGQPPSAAHVFCFIFLRDGELDTTSTVVNPEGRFIIPHPGGDDLRPRADVTRLLCWAQQEGSLSPPLDGAPPGTPVALQLQPQAPPARVRLVALDAFGDGRYDEDLQVLLAPGVPDQVGLQALGKGGALELEGVAPGPTVLTLFSPQGIQVTHRLQLQPGADHLVEVPFAFELPPGKVGLLVDESLAVVAVPHGTPADRAGVRKGDVILDVEGQRPQDRKQAIELLGGPPGTPVSVNVRRGGATQSLRIVRSEAHALPPPRITVKAPPAPKAPPLIQPGPGERVLAEAAVPDRETGGPSRVGVDEAIPIPPELGPAYQRHPQLQIGSYRLQARATVQAASDPGARPLVVLRALFRSGDKALLVDVGESGRPNAELESALSTGRWAQAPWVKARDRQAIKVLQRPDGFEAAWYSDVLVRVAGTALGPAEQAVIDAYLARFPSRRPAPP